MPVTARLSERFYHAFGDEIANDLVDWFNQVDATYRQELRDQNELDWGRVEARIAQVEARMDGLLTGLRADPDGGLELLRSDLFKWMFRYWTGTALTVIGLVIALRR